MDNLTRTGSSATLIRLVVLAGVLLLACDARRSEAVVGSPRAAAILVFPVVKLNACASGDCDTEIEIANTRSAPVALECHYVNGLGACSAAQTECRTAADCNPGESCVFEWQNVDFLLKLTAQQVITWQVGQGLTHLPCDVTAPSPACIGQSEGAIPAVPSDPFLGELKCIEVSDVMQPMPVAANDLIGSATIIDHVGPDAASYAAVGIESTGVNDGDRVLCLGRDAAACTTAEYAPCPATLAMNQFNENANLQGRTIRSSLFLVPCSQDFEGLQPTSAVVQFMVTNEFEQVLSAAILITCFGEVRLADSQAFDAGLLGSLTGYTRIHALKPGAPGQLQPLVGVVIEEHTTGANPPRRAAFGLTSLGANPGADVIHLPQFP